MYLHYYNTPHTFGTYNTDPFISIDSSPKEQWQCFWCYVRKRHHSHRCLAGLAASGEPIELLVQDDKEAEDDADIGNGGEGGQGVQVTYP